MTTNINDILRRITIFYLVTVMLSILFVAQIIYLQFFTDYKQQAKEIAVKQEFIEADRGNIFSNDGKLLATSLPVYEVRMDFAADGIVDSVFEKNVGILADNLSELFKDQNQAKYKAYLEKCFKEKNKNRYKKIGNRFINFIELQNLKKFPFFKLGSNKSGLIVLEKTKRYYPYKSLAHRTIGDVNSNDEAKVGIESKFNEFLQGKKGSQLVQRIAGGEWMPINSEYDEAPESGYDVVTTLDIDIQDVAENALRKQLCKQSEIEGGTVLVMDVQTGEIRAIANMRHDKDGTYSERYNYAIREINYPGSTFKLASLIALIDDGYVDLNTIVETSTKWLYDGKNFSEAGGHQYGTIPVKKVFEKSSNVGFAKLVAKYYEKNPQKFINKLKSMGLFRKTLNLQIDGEGSPFIRETTNKFWRKQTLPFIAIGYEALIAPIHTLTLYNAVANGGKMMKPKLVKRIENHGTIIKTYDNEVIEDSICSQKTIKLVKEALIGVVDSGTAKHIKDSRYTIAGKTGTAQRIVNGKIRDSQGRTAYQASFAGFFPAENPKYTIVVAMYSYPLSGNFYGGTWAAPVFKEVADKIYASGKDWFKPIEKAAQSIDLPEIKTTKTENAREIAKNIDIPINIQRNSEWTKFLSDSTKIVSNPLEFGSDTVPQVVNMGLRDAVCVLENLGMKVTFDGVGKVISQSVEPGSKIIKGNTIHIILGI